MSSLQSETVAERDLEVSVFRLLVEIITSLDIFTILDILFGDVLVGISQRQDKARVEHEALVFVSHAHGYAYDHAVGVVGEVFTLIIIYHIILKILTYIG